MQPRDRRAGVALLGLLLACAHPRETTAAPVVVDRAARMQRMDGIGWNAWAFVWANDLGHDARELAILEAEPPRYVRLAGWFTWWETENDDADPHHTDLARMMREHVTPRTHDLVAARDLTKRGVDIALGIWDLPAWLVDDKRTVLPGTSDEIAESIASYAKFLVDGGAVISSIEVQNEPEIAALTRYPSPEALRDAGRALVRELDARGLERVMLHAPNADRPSRTVPWAEVWLADDVLRARTQAVSFHTWWDDDEASYRAIRTVAAKYGKPVWATEDGACADEHKGCSAGSAFAPSTWETAWDTATSTWRAIAWAGAARVYHWSLVGNGGAIAVGGARTPTHEVTAQLAAAIPAGSTSVGVTAPPGVRALAFDDGSRVHLVLLADGAVDVRVDGAVSHVVQSTRAAQRIALPSTSTTLHLPAQSVTTLIVE